MSSPSHPPHLVRTLLVVLALALVAAGCSGGGDDADDAGTTTTTDPSAPATTTTDPSDPSGGSSTGPGGSPVTDGIRIEVLSSQPDRVSGAEARVRVTPAEGGAVDDLRLQLGDVDVTQQLTERDGGLEGVVTGFIEGNNVLTAAAAGDEVTQRVRAWPLAGPVLSGPHLPLLACATEANGLGRATDADCAAPTRTTWSYLDAAGRLRPLEDRRREPADLATATIDGQEVPLYVRVEKGVINRSVYEIASVDPTPGDDDPTGPGWNDRLLYRFGGLCGTTFGQGSPATPAASPAYLRQGYAVATASFNNASVQCNDVISAETTMMVKERFIEEFGRPVHTIGEGASGGAAQLHLLVQNYPGLVDGVAATSPFPDILSVLSGASDCGLLERYYGTADGRGLTDAQRAAINGHATAGTCRSWAPIASDLLDPTDGCDPGIDPAATYDAVRNPGGVRCDLAANNISQFGVDAASGRAKRPLDNVGVQYGLTALTDGAITVDQFLALNEAVGGYDLDGGHQPAREEASPDDVLDAYSTGRIANGGGDLLSTPMIDVNTFTDPTGDVHDRFRAFSLRNRLASDATPDDAPGFQIWTRPGPATLDAARAAVGTGPAGPEAVAAIDAWLTALAADTSGGSRQAALARTRPDTATDRCLLPGAEEPTTGDDVYADDGPCTTAFPVAGDPRTAAGAPPRDDVIKCQLRPIDPSEYGTPLTPAQAQRLADTFPTGVCDWSSIGEGETLPADPGRDYGDVVTPQQRA